MKTFKVNEQFLQSIFEYLMTKPMREVEALVNEIRKCQPIEEENK